jgi:hypothetical protein
LRFGTIKSPLDSNKNKKKFIHKINNKWNSEQTPSLMIPLLFLLFFKLNMVAISQQAVSAASIQNPAQSVENVKHHNWEGDIQYTVDENLALRKHTVQQERFLICSTAAHCVILGYSSRQAGLQTRTGKQYI